MVEVVIVNIILVEVLSVVGIIKALVLNIFVMVAVMVVSGDNRSINSVVVVVAAAVVTVLQ